MSARVVALARRPGRREPMEGLDRLTLDVDEGVVEDFSGRGHRQVTLLEREAWEAVERELGERHPWSTRRADILVEGIRLVETIGRVLEIGGCRIRIHGETVPCGLMDELVPGLREALGPDCRGGVHGEVLAGGDVRPGMLVSIIDE